MLFHICKLLPYLGLFAFVTFIALQKLYNAHEFTTISSEIFVILKKF